MMTLMQPRLPKRALVLIYLAAALLAGLFFFMQVRAVFADPVEDAVVVNIAGAKVNPVTIASVSTSAGDDRILVVTAAFKPSLVNPTTRIASVPYNGVK